MHTGHLNQCLMLCLSKYTKLCRKFWNVASVCGSTVPEIQGQVRCSRTELHTSLCRIWSTSCSLLILRNNTVIRHHSISSQLFTQALTLPMDLGYIISIHVCMKIFNSLYYFLFTSVLPLYPYCCSFRSVQYLMLGILCNRETKLLGIH